LVGHAVGSNLGTRGFDLASALADDANGSAVTTAVQIAISMNRTLRILAPVLGR
jgi:hypothetical protein